MAKPMGSMVPSAVATPLPPEVEEDGVHVTQTGSDADEPQVDGLDLQIPGEVDGSHALEHVEQQDDQRGHPATEAQHIGRPRVVGAMVAGIRQTREAGNQHGAGQRAAQIGQNNHQNRQGRHLGRFTTI